MVPMKYDSQQPIPASPATTVMFKTGVSVGEMAASDCPIVSINPSAFERRRWPVFSATTPSLVTLIDCPRMSYAFDTDLPDFHSHVAGNSLMHLLGTGMHRVLLTIAVPAVGHAALAQTPPPPLLPQPTVAALAH